MRDDISLSPAIQLQLSSWAVEDDMMALAYDAVGAEHRSRMKQCIARLYALWGESPLKNKVCRTFSSGFSVKESSSPAPFALIVCNARYAYPAALLAAVLPALSSGVTPLCFLTDMPIDSSSALPARSGDFACESLFMPVKCSSPACREVNQALLCALELAGVDSLFFAPYNEILRFFSEQASLQGQGRLIVLTESFSAETLLLESLRLGIPALSLMGIPSYSMEHQNTSAYHLVLDPAHAHMFSWPQLGPKWFRNRCFSFVGETSSCP